MNKPRLLTLVGILSLILILAIVSPLGRVEADHCHTTEGQTPPANVQPPAQPAPSSAERSRAARRIVTRAPSAQNTRAASRSASSAIAPGSATPPSIEQIYSRDLPLAIQSLERAVKAVESGDKQTELAELGKAVNMLAAIHESLGKHVKAPSTPSISFRRGSAGVLSEASESKDLSPSTPSATGVGASGSPGADGSRACPLGTWSRDLVNARCPIMGSAIKPESVTANLTRDYNGQKIGFCCAGCPSAWDKLTDAEKQAKLSAVKS